MLSVFLTMTESLVFNDKLSALLIRNVKNISPLYRQVVKRVYIKNFVNSPRTCNSLLSH